MATLTQEQLKAILHYEPETGVFTHLRSIGRVKKGDVAGSHDGCGYIKIAISSKFHSAHRLAWLYVHGHFPKNEIDHINRVRDDNRIANLRDVTKAENLRNTCRSIIRPQGTAEGRDSKRCTAEYDAFYYRANKEKRKAQVAAWAESNKARKAKADAARYARNKARAALSKATGSQA